MSTYNLIIEISERKRTREKRGRTDQYEKTTVPKRTRNVPVPLTIVGGIFSEFNRLFIILLVKFITKTSVFIEFTYAHVLYGVHLTVFMQYYVMTQLYEHVAYYKL